MKTAIVLLSVILFSACGNSRQEKNTMQDEAGKQPSALTAIDNNDFSIKCETSGQSGDQDKPEVNFLLESEKLKATVLVATEPGCSQISDRSGFNMPEKAAFAISGYAAGGGNYYYGLVKNDTLSVYRQYIEESHPENDANPAETKYNLFKIIVIKSDQTASVETVGVE